MRSNLCVLVFIEFKRQRLCLCLGQTRGPWPIKAKDNASTRPLANEQQGTRGTSQIFLLANEQPGTRGTFRHLNFLPSIKIHLSKFLTRPVTNKVGRNLPL